MNPPTRQFEFDAQFQFKLLCLLLRDPTLIPSWRSLLRPNYFTDQTAQEFLRLAYNYYDHYRRLPSWEALKQILTESKQFNTTPERRQNADLWADTIFQTQLTDQEYIKDQVEDFIRTQEYTLAVLEAADHINKGRSPDLVPDIIKQAQERLASAKTDDLGLFLMGMTPQERFDIIFSKPARETFSTYWTTANELGAVPARKELFVVAAPPNVGKSWTLGNIGAAGVASGLFVSFYTLEMSRVLNAYRIYSILSERTDKEIKAQPSILNDVCAHHYSRGGEIVVVEYETGGATVNHIEDHIMRLQLKYGRKPDMVIVDYADLLAPVNSSDKRSFQSEDQTVVRHILAKIYRDLRRIAAHHNVAVVTASQTNRQSLAQERITMKDLAEAFEKASIADTIWALCRTEDEENLNKARLFLAKNRNEERYKTIDLSLDFSIGKMEELSLGSPSYGQQPQSFNTQDFMAGITQPTQPPSQGLAWTS